MKTTLLYLMVLYSFFSFGCSKVSPDAVDLNVDFTWKGLILCTTGGNPEIRVTGIPDTTRYLMVTLYDHGMTHGKQTIEYDGSGIINEGALDQIPGPCPNMDSGRYKFKIEAVNANRGIIGIGSKERYYPEEDQ